VGARRHLGRGRGRAARDRRLDRALQAREARREAEGDVLSAAGPPRGAAFFPALFVLLWSTGFIAAKLGLPDAPPFHFLAVRMIAVAVLMALVAWATGARWPSARVAMHAGFVGLLVHGLYLGGVFVALSGGMPAGTAAMLVGLQPIVTVWIAHTWLGERVVMRQWIGLALGLAGVALVVRHKLGFSGDLSGLLPALVALAGISIGTLWQKRHASHVDLRAGAAIQYAVCAAAFAPLALFLETTPIRWTPSFAFALAWSVLVLSVGAISLLWVLLRHGAATNVAALFYLVPPVTALMAWLLFGETLDALALGGMVLIAMGVALARASAPAQPE
jgi:drug/metabolite transporter (DMT)-like permease